MPHKNLLDNDRTIREEVRRLEDRRLVKRCPSNKRRYISEAAADDTRIYQEKIDHIKLYIYKCPICKSYHLTKSPQ